MSDLRAWIHDDITWCVHNECPMINCFRNPKNMNNHAGLHSYADFRECDECIIYKLEQLADMEREKGK